MSTPLPDLFDLAKAEKYDEIDAFFLDQKSAVEMILMKYDTHDGWCLFQDICLNPKVPLEFVIGVLQIVGTKMSDDSCRGSLEHILNDEYRRQCVEEKVRIIEVIMDELGVLEGDEYIDLKAQLLAVGVINGVSKKAIKALLQFRGEDILYKKHMILATYCNTAQQTVNVKLIKNAEVETQKIEDENIRLLEATILELAIYSRQTYEVVKCILSTGKELISMSKRSLFQGAILEYNQPIAADIVHLLLYYGEEELVMNHTSWNESFLEEMGIFHFLNYKKKFLQEEADAKKEKDAKTTTLGFEDMKRIMHLLLDAHGTNLVRRRYGSSGSILHFFDYYDHKSFTAIVNRIIATGGKTIFEIKNENGDNFLHHLVASNKDILPKNWNSLTNSNVNVNMMAQNKIGQTPLHIACKMNRVDCIDALLKAGDDDFVKMRDNDGNTALHLLPAIDASASSILEKLIAVGGKQLFSMKNNANKVPSNQFASNYLDDYENMLDEAVSWKQQLEHMQEHMQEREKEFASIIKDEQQKQKEQKSHIKSLQKNLDEKKEYIAMVENRKRQDEIEFSEATRKLQQLEEENAKLQKVIEQQRASQIDIETSPSRKRPRNELECYESNAGSPKSPFGKLTRKISSLFQKREEKDTCDVDSQEKVESNGLFTQISALQSENKDLLKQLETEKTNHAKTLQRLKDARVALKNCL